MNLSSKFNKYDIKSHDTFFNTFDDIEFSPESDGNIAKLNTIVNMIYNYINSRELFIGGIMNALQGLGSTQPQQKPTQTQAQTQSQGFNLKEMLSNISESDMDALREVFNELLNNENKKVEQKIDTSVKKAKNNEQSIEQILSNLDFNSILNSINSMDLSNIDFENFDINNFNIDDITFNAEQNDDELNIKNVDDQDIIEENTFINKNKKLSEDELYDIINVLVRLIEPSKIATLQKFLKS